MKFTKKNGGFTLVELIVVIAILAILAAIAVPAYSGYIQKANEAGDQQLLAAVNTAYAAACLENNEDMLSLKKAHIHVDPATGIIDLTRTNPYGEEFELYFGENKNTAFKVIKGLRFDPDKKVFVDNTGRIDNAVVRIEGSNYNGNIPTLTGSVNNLAGLLGDRIDADGLENLYKGSANMSDEEFNNFMNTYKLNEESGSTEIANATVMYVADKLSGHTAEDIYTIMDGNAQNLIGEFGTIPAAAMMYGLMAGYQDSEYNVGGAFKLNANPNGLSDVMNQFGALQSDPNFDKYFKNADAMPGADADLEGFLAAMDVVNGYEGSFDLTQEDLFISEDVNNLLNSILGNS